MIALVPKQIIFASFPQENHSSNYFAPAKGKRLNFSFIVLLRTSKVFNRDLIGIAGIFSSLFCCWPFCLSQVKCRQLDFCSCLFAQITRNITQNSRDSAGAGPMFIRIHSNLSKFNAWPSILRALVLRKLILFPRNEFSLSAIMFEF